MRLVVVGNMVLALALMAGAFFAVFIQNRSPWWFAVAVAAYWALGQSVTTKTEGPDKDGYDAERHADFHAGVGK